MQPMELWNGRLYSKFCAELIVYANSYTVWSALSFKGYKQAEPPQLFIFFVHYAQKCFKTDPEGTTCENTHRSPRKNNMGFKQMWEDAGLTQVTQDSSCEQSNQHMAP